MKRLGSLLAETKEMCLDAFIGLSQAQPDGTHRKPKHGSAVGSTKKRKQKIADLMHEWHQGFIKQHRAGLIRDATVRNRKSNMDGLIPFLNQEGLIYKDQIKVGCFDNYPIYRAEYTIWTWKRELTHLKEFLVHLVTAGHLDAALLINKKLIPAVKPKDSDYDSNPPWRDSDLKVFWDEMHGWMAEGGWKLNGRWLHSRRRMWTCFKYLRDTGCRPGETLGVRWSDIEFVDVKRVSESLFQEMMQKLEEDESGIKPDVITHIRVLHTKTHKAREITCIAAEC